MPSSLHCGVALGPLACRFGNIPPIKLMINIPAIDPRIIAYPRDLLMNVFKHSTTIKKCMLE